MEEELFDNTIVLTDEDGNEVPFEFLDLIEYEGNEYVVLLPTEDEDDDQVVILQVEDSGEDTESYFAVEDEEILQAVFDIFRDKFADEFHFTEQ